MPEMLPCYVYVDGQYVRAEFRSEDKADEFYPRKAALFARRQGIAGAQFEPTRVFYYDAIDEAGDPKEQQRQRDYFKRISADLDTHVIVGQVRKTARKRTQKGVDVQMAVDALRAAISGAVKGIALVTGDADFVPLVRAIREAGPHVIVMGFKESLAPELEREADRVWKWDTLPTDWYTPP